MSSDQPPCAPAESGTKPGAAPSLAELLRHTPHLWRGRDGLPGGAAVLPTGFPVLDAAVGGWPRGALTEIVVPVWGIGELRLLLPAMRALQEEGRPLVWIAPPFLPYAPALAAAGVDLRRLLLLDGLATEKDLWWAMEASLRSAACGLVLGWPGRPGDRTMLRRLQLAAADGRSLALLLAAEHLSGTPAALRLRLQTRDDGLYIQILKQRGLPRTDGVHLCW